MTRTKGSTNRDHAEKRAALGRAIAGAVFREGPAVSLHELARAADVR